MKKIKYYLTIFSIFIAFHSGNTQVIASFFSLDTACINQPISIQNTSSEDAQTYYWNFCSLDLDNLPQYESLGNLNTLDQPTFITIINDNNNYYGFVTNFGSRDLVRLDFGSDLNNTPSAISLGSFSAIQSSGLEGIAILKEEENWWGFATTGGADEPALLRFNFGNSLLEMPTAVNLGNVGELDEPHELMIFKENNNWFGFTLNKGSKSITRFSFGNSLSNVPLGENLGDIGDLNGPVGFFPISKNDEWHLFICNNYSQSISRLDFGNSLTNIPTGLNFGSNTSFNKPRDIFIYERCGSLFGLVLNRDSDNITLLDFENDITNNPVTVEVPPLEGFDFPHSFSNTIRIGNEENLFVVNVYNSNLVKMELESCDNAYPLSSNIETPPTVMYNEPGNYVIELIIDEGLLTEDRFCKSIYIKNFEFDLGMDTTICVGESIILNSSIYHTQWSDGSINPNFSINKSGNYHATADTLGCLLSDSINVGIIDCQNCVVFPNAFTPDGDGQNDGFSALSACPFEILYFEMKIYDRWGTLVFESFDPNIKWNGSYQNTPLPTEVYIWTAQFSYPDSKTGRILNFKEQGDITLIR